MKLLNWLGIYLSTESRFLKTSTLGLGLPAAVLGVWAFREFGEVAYVLVVPLAFVGAYAWGFVMWRLMFADLYATKRRLRGLKQSTLPHSDAT